MTQSFQEIRTGHLYRLYTGFKKIYPKFLFLFERGNHYEAYYGDALLLAEHAGAPLDFFEGVPIARFPIEGAERFTKPMTKDQWVIGICDRED